MRFRLLAEEKIRSKEKEAHLDTRKTKSVKNREYPFYVIKTYLDMGYWEKCDEKKFKTAAKKIVDFLLTPDSNTLRIADEYNWMVDIEELWGFQLDKQD